MKTKILYALCVALPLNVLANGSLMQQQYIDKYKEVAIREMRQFGIPASITLAQGLLESGSGNSFLATEANNHFGIKCHLDWAWPQGV
ncbi:MAG: glucosaminidase domain-containing protein [Owenweeksia sp.]|nr:glucosaminidase domain-containing protein [Owenweeksia sp.]